MRTQANGSPANAGTACLVNKLAGLSLSGILSTRSNKRSKSSINSQPYHLWIHYACLQFTNIYLDELNVTENLKVVNMLSAELFCACWESSSWQA